MPEFESLPLDNRGPTYTDEYRQPCEGRYVVALPGRDRRRAYLEAVERLRGKAAAERLRADILTAWKRRT